MASASSAIDCCDNYDVFLSFRGKDTRYNFTSHLHKSFFDHNIKVFIDYNIRRGQEITLAIERVIEGAKMSIIVFSKNYAKSTFCLDELLKIMECRESKEQTVLPIFYKVEPSEEIYQEAFESHGKETINQEMKVERWKSAFRKALGLAGEQIDDKSNEAERIETITTEVLVTLKEMNNDLPKGEELMCTSMVGQKAEVNFKKIWECLMNDRISRVGLYGMGGVGKTTIATRVNDQLLASVNSFSRICWVTVSKDLSICNIQNKIAKMIELDFSNEDDERKRAAKLRKRLKTEKFVLILDDVWEAFEIEEVGIPPLVDGQKLFMTSRSRRVCEMMECQPIEVKPLSTKDALHLFMKESKCQNNDFLQLGDIVGSIVEECGGLPLAIVVIARRMRGVKEIWKWRDTLRELQKPCKGENPEIEEKVYKVLKFSYDCLRNDRCRQCFLYCSLFPEDHQFKRDDLIEYWIGEGLIDEVDCRLAELDKGNVILDELIHSSLLEVVDSRGFKRIKMHDVIRDMARMNVKVGLQFEDSFESVQVLRMLKSFSNSTPHCSKLRTLLLQGYDINELLGCLFANMQSLCVLHMKSMDNVKSIPDTITNLGNLRLLMIHYCNNLECIPSLVGLEKLRHLKISWNKRLKEIPKGIERLGNLKVLDLSWNVSLKEIPKGMERLVNLKVLDLSMNRCLNGSFPSGVVEKLSHLQTLNLIGTRVEVELEAHISLEKLEVLKIHFFNLQKLISYVKSGHWRRLLEYHIHYGEQAVSYVGNVMWSKIMSFKANKDVEEWKGEFGMFLPYDVQCLKLVYWDSAMFYYLMDPNFVNLRSISIGWCNSRNLFTVDLAQHLLHNIQELSIYRCYELVEIIGGEEWFTILLPNLKKLTLYKLPKLRSIYSRRMVCPSLELVKIYECDKIERLPFCMEKEGYTQNPTIKLEGMTSNKKWWDSLQWDDPNAKSMYLPIFNSEHDSDSKCEGE